MNKDNYDIFVSNSVYPDAESIFQFSLKPLNEIKDDCYVVIDTNTLLLPYTVTSESLQEIRNTYLQLIQFKRLIIPGQVAREFAKNRANKISELHKQISKTRDSQQSSKLDFYPILESMNEFQEVRELYSKIDSHVKEYRKKLGEVLEKVKGWIWDDPVTLVYKDLFSVDVIIDLDINHEKQEEIKQDLNHRSIHKIPPGYKDHSKSDQGIGDLLIWRTILDIGHRHKQSVVFVSSDEKSDWWHRSDNQTLYPRYELVDEFRRASNQQSFHIVTFSAFLELYGASQNVIKEVRREEQIKITYKDDYISYLNSLPKLELEHVIDNLIADTQQEILDLEEVVDETEGVSALGWTIEDYTVTEIDVSGEECIVKLTYSGSGDSEIERGFPGGKIDGKAEATIDEFGDVTYQNVSVEAYSDWGTDYENA